MKRMSLKARAILFSLGLIIVSWLLPLATVVKYLISNSSASYLIAGAHVTNRITYAGPGDVVSGAVFFAGLRAYSAAKALAHVNAIELCTALDAACEIETFGDDGNISLGALGNTCNNALTICTVKTLYDQIGGLTSVPSTIARRAVFFVNCSGSKPCMQTIGTTNQGYTFVAIGGSTAQPYTFSFVGQRSGQFSTLTGMFSSVDGNTNGSFRGQTSADNMILLAGVNGGVTVSDSTFHSITAVFQGTPTVIRVDSTETTFGSTFTGHTNAFGPNIGFFKDANTGAAPRSCTCKGFEGGIWPTLAMDATQRTNLNANSKTFWGF